MLFSVRGQAQSSQQDWVISTATGFAGVTGLSGDAKFTVTTNQITLIIDNTYQNPTADTSTISGVTFTVSGATGSGITTTGTANVATLAKNSAYTVTNKNIDTGHSGHWDVTNYSNTLTVTALSGGKPNETIIGPDNAGSVTGGGVYSNIDSSVTGHNPLVIGSATFILSVPGVTAASVISSVTFNAGTQTGQTWNARIQTPEPTFYGYFAALAVTAGTVLRKRRRQICARRLEPEEGETAKGASVT